MGAEKLNLGNGGEGWDFDDKEREPESELSREDRQEHGRRILEVMSSLSDGEEQGEISHAEEIKATAAAVLEAGKVSEVEGRRKLSEYYDKYKDEQLGFFDFVQEVRRHNANKYLESVGPETKFYFSTTLEHALDFLKNGAIEKTSHADGRSDVNSEETLLPTLIHLSRDEVGEDGEIKSGIDADRGQISDEVVFVFGPSIAQNDRFEYLGRYPATRAVPTLNCLSIVGQTPEIVDKILDSGTYEMVFSREDWDNMETSLGNLRMMEEETRDERFDTVRERRKERLKREVFDEVDNDVMNELIRSYAEKLDVERLEEIRAEMMMVNNEIGALKMVDYLTEVLELSEKPQIGYYDKLDGDARGSCTSRLGGDLIKVSRKYATLYNVSRQMETIAHECWHSYQHMVSDVGEGGVWQDRCELYGYNFDNYVSGSTDFELYQKQLVEVEARAFGGALRERLKEYEPLTEEMERKVFTDVDKREVNRVVDEVMDKIKINELLEATGKTDVKELFECKIGEVIPKLMGYLNMVLGMEHPVTVKTGELPEDSSLFLDCRNFELVINDKVTDKKFERYELAFLCERMWVQSRYDFLKREPYDVRGELYQYNFDNYAYQQDNATRAEKQLLTVESRRFSESVLAKVRDSEKWWSRGRMGKLVRAIRKKMGER